MEYSRTCGVNNIVLKARQMGTTTWIAARFFIATITGTGILSVLVAHDQASAEEIFRIVRRFWANLPERLRKGALRTSHANVRQMVFRTYARCLLKCMPRPDFAFLLDADPAQARARKPEYPISFLERNRASYIAMSGWAEGMIIIPPLPVDDVTVTILRKVSARLSMPTSSVRPSAVAAGPTSK